MTMKLWSTKEAMLVKRYLELRIDFHGRVSWGGDPCSRPVEELKWNELTPKALYHITESEGEDQWGFKNEDGWSCYNWM
jgi:hypothetical protein